MSSKSISGELLMKMFIAGAKNLEAKKEWINELNVFPVPDGDTGTNMTMTIISAAEMVAAVPEVNLKTISKAMSSGSLRGARGNSGVILSQLIRGFSKVMGENEEADVLVLSEACQKAVETAYKAVMKPKEGTILTVARGIADRAAALMDETDDPEFFINECIKEGERVLSKTPDMLPVLKQAGVVDSGGQGLMEFLKGARDAFLGKEVDLEIDAKRMPTSTAVKTDASAEEEIKFGYCTEFIINIDKPLTEKEELEYKSFLESIGDSIVVVADDDLVKTHVHTNHPGQAIEKALTLGSLSRMKIDNMREEHNERLIKQAELEAQAKASGAAKEDGEQKTPSEPPKEFGFVSVSVGEGLSEIFDSLGVDHIIEGGQTMNPSTDDILTAAENVNAKTVFVLPNNKNIILAANQAAAICEDKKLIVIPSKTIPQGISALVNYMPDSSCEENEANMNEGLSYVKTGQVTYAVRDTEIDGHVITKGDYMGIGDEGIISVEKDLEDCAVALAEGMVDEESGLISVYYGEDVKEGAAEKLVAKLKEKYEGLEIELSSGGQPVYNYIVSVE